MSAEHTEHDAETPHHAFDSPEEVAHAKQHAVENIYFFIGFFTLILFAVANYEFYGATNIWAILLLAAFRSALIACFFVWLIGHFSLVVRTLVFTIIFFMGMVFLSMWDSTLPHFGNPIVLPPKLSDATPTAPPTGP